MEIKISRKIDLGILPCVVCGMGMNVGCEGSIKEATYSEKRYGCVINYHYFAHSHHDDEDIQQAVLKALKVI